MSAPVPAFRSERGMVLITSLLLLLVLTILAVAMFRGNGLEGLIAGNVMDKQRAVQAATSAQDYAEQWLVNNVQSTYPVVCSGSTFTTTPSPAICSNTLATPAVVPWAVGGYSYSPTIPVFNGTGVQSETFPVSSSGGVDEYYQSPSVYIAQLGADATLPNAVDYQVDAWTYGGAESTVAVVESIYQIRYTSKPPGP